MKSPGTRGDRGNAAPAGFRAKLTIAMMLVVCVVTAATLYLSQRNAEATYRQSLQAEFQNRIGFVFGAQDVRRAAVAERCRVLARSVRIRAALEEEDVEDLYANASIELRDVLGGGGGTDESRQTNMPRASFFRFLDPKGRLYLPPGTNPAAWEKKLEHPDLSRGNQQVGYIPVKLTGADAIINEVVCTPIIGEDGAMLGALVLGFPPADISTKSQEEIETGIWVDRMLYMHALLPTERAELSTDINNAIGSQASEENNFLVQFRGEPHLLFHKNLNPGSQFPPAYEICLYSLADALAKQRVQEWKIVGVAAVVLVIGLAASHFFSTRLSKPVEKLAEDSAQNLALREEAETALGVTEQKYRAIFENAVEGIFILSADGAWTSVNPAMARIFGYETPAEFLSEAPIPPQKLYCEPGRCTELLDAARREEVVSSFETKMLRRDGTEIWVSQNLRGVRDAAGGLLHFEGTLEDITERKRSADSLRELNQELEKALSDLKATQRQVIQQERLRALGQMASGIAHDFNNALMPVTGFSDLLLVDPNILGNTKKATEYLGIIRTAAQDAANIVARLREFYRSNEHGDILTQIDLKRLAGQVISLTQPKWKNQAQAGGAEIQVQTELADVPPIVGDESSLREVLTNLIFNAVDAMPHGGTLKIRTFRQDESAVIEVSDTGMGMSDEVRERCMEPFFSTKGERGTGLGLAMVFGIVQRHEGKIDLKTKPGEGTAFELSFPARTLKPGASDSSSASQRQQRLRVLVVDDEPQACKVLTAFLEHEGHQVQTAEHGVDGLRRFLDGKFDLVITDKAMPGMNGDQMAAAIKQFAPRTPIVLLTGFHNVKHDEAPGDIDMIVNKPITLDTLKETICKVMATA